MADSIGARVRALRQKRGLSQKQLAEAAGVSQQSVSDLENAPERDPGVMTTLAIAGALGVELQALVPSLTQPASVAEKARRSAEARIPRPVADAIQALRGQVKIALDEAREARRLAEEAVNQGRRRGKRSA